VVKASCVQGHAVQERRLGLGAAKKAKIIQTGRVAFHQKTKDGNIVLSILKNILPTKPLRMQLDGESYQNNRAWFVKQDLRLKLITRIIKNHLM